MIPFGPLAITADDYGLTDGINEGIVDLARMRAVTGVSVMCHPAASHDKISRLKNTGVLTGVHLVLVEERPVLADDPGLKPLLDRRGRLPDGWQRLFAIVMMKPWVLSALKREVEAQINRFVELGLSLDFINSHQHTHLFPPIWLVLRPLLESYRVPIRGTAAWDWRGTSPQGMINVASWLSWHLGKRGNDRLSLRPLGVDCAGHFSIAEAEKLLRDVPIASGREVPELVVHPGCEDRQARDHYAHWRYQWDQERVALASDGMQALLEQLGCDLLGASMKIRERDGGSPHFSARSPSSELVLALAWPQSWEQVVLFARLAEGLTKKGAVPRQIFPDLLSGLERHQFEHYRGFSSNRRLIDLLLWLKTLGQRIDNDQAVLHMVLPSPAWSWLAAMIRFPGDRILLHYTGRAVAWNWTNGKEILTDPWFVMSAMLANPAFLVRLARRVKAAHVTMDVQTAARLLDLGCQRVFKCPGLVEACVGSGIATEGKSAFVVDSAKILIGFSGQGAPMEGVWDLLRAMASSGNSRLHLLLLVEDRQRMGTLRKTINRLGLVGRVDMTGVERETEVMSQVDAMVLPYRSAVVSPLYPQALLAAAAKGCPIITTAIPAWEHLFNLTSPRLTIVSPGDVSALKRILVTLGKRKEPVSGELPPLKLSDGHQGIEALSAVYHRLGGGRFVPGEC
ncbi:MAG: ChbG/HpnK family deacetylase [Magnetococcales bacterium]|nr:ChbG/HpnK family deacetylase [Magnetococcales bacterium]